MVPFLHRIGPSTMEENPLWLVVLCDLMTNLMLFFLVMYSFTLQEPEDRTRWIQRFNAEGFIENPKEKKMREVINGFQESEAANVIRDRLKKAGLAGETDVILTERSIRVRLKNHVIFPTAEASLMPESRRTIALLSGVVKTIPNDVIVEGHTDDVPVTNGPYKTNWELSVARSYSVIQEMVWQGIDPRRLIASGYGEYHPLAPNTSAESRGLNRRVEVVIVRERRSDKLK